MTKSKQSEPAWWETWQPPAVFGLIAFGSVVGFFIMGFMDGMENGLAADRAIYECEADKLTLQGRIDLLQERVDFRPVATHRMQAQYEVSLSWCQASLERASHDILLCIPGDARR